MSEETGDEQVTTENASTAEFENLEKSNDAVDLDGKPELDLILDIPVTMSMEIGRTNLSIRNLLQLNLGSVIELDKQAGEPLNILVNGTLIAHGEVVVVNDKFGLRLTDVVSTKERLQNING